MTEIAIHPTAVVVIKWPSANVPARASVEVSLDNGDTWNLAELNDGNVEVLVAHPNVPDLDTSAIVAPGPGVHRMFVRFAEDAERVVLDAGTLVVD